MWTLRCSFHRTSNYPGIRIIRIKRETPVCMLSDSRAAETGHPAIVVVWGPHVSPGQSWRQITCVCAIFVPCPNQTRKISKTEKNNKTRKMPVLVVPTLWRFFSVLWFTIPQIKQLIHQLYLRCHFRFRYKSILLELSTGLTSMACRQYWRCVSDTCLV